MGFPWWRGSDRMNSTLFSTYAQDYDQLQPLRVEMYQRPYLAPFYGAFYYFAEVI